VALSGAVVLAGTDGLFLIGGTDGTRPVNTVYKSTFDKTGAPQKWVQEPAQLYTPVTDASAAIVGSYVWVYGGTMADGTATGTVQRGEFGTADKATTLVQFGVRSGNINLPAPRANINGFAANGNLYAVGGTDGTTPQRTLYWGVPTTGGDIPEWKHLVVSDLGPEGNAGGAPLVLGPDAIIIGGTTTAGVTTASVRANIAPSEPFFQLGLFGAIVPALKIDGEIGQQLGYLNANTIGVINFAILVAIGVAFAHRPQIKAWRDRRRREKELKARA
jgi:hypothetical protein